MSARDHAQRAARQDEAAAPENRLVARELARRWEEALGHEPHWQEEEARCRRERPPELTPREWAAILRLAHGVPALWHAAETTPQDRQASGRLLVARVTVDGPDDRAQVEVLSHWAGGVTSARRLRRPVARDDQRSSVTTLLARIDGLRRAGPSCAQIAERVHHAGCYPPQRTAPFTGETVARLLGRHGLHGPRPRALDGASVPRPHEYWLAD